MGRLEEWALRVYAASRLSIGFAVAMQMYGCDGQQTSFSEKSTGTADTAVAGATTQASRITVAVTPPPRPSFDLTIHDYVIDCSSNPQVQFAATLPGGQFFSLFGPGSDASMASPLPVGYFSKTFTIQPGQRFRFFLGADTAEYSVRCIPKDFPPISVSIAGSSAPQAAWYLFAPTIGSNSSYVVITDAHGTPVWWMNDPGSPIDAKILSSNRIAWTLASVYGVGGQYFIRNFAGKVLTTLSGNLDDHELQETPTGTYLAIRDVPRVCPPDCADMSPWGGNSETAAIDAEIIEIDELSNVLWTWRTRDHIALAETGESGWFPQVGNDIIHMNAVEPDGTGGVLFSARHLNAIYHITKSSGAIDWKIGGVPRPESLAVLGDTRPTSMGSSGQVLSGQHDVRTWPDGTISVHDNGTIANRPPFILRYQIDTDARTASVLEEIQDQRVPYSGCCGSARRLPAGHWLVAWGEQPFMTELDSAGSPVFTVQYNLGPGFSYRAVPVLPGAISPEVLREGMDSMAGY